MRAEWASTLAVGLVCGLVGNVVGQTTTSATTASAQPACSTTLSAGSSTPSVNPDYQYRLVSSGLARPRGIIFDSAGNLLVVQQGRGIVALQLDGDGVCLTASDPTTVVDSSDLNHGIAFSPDGRTLYASSSEALFAWDYDARSASVTSENRTLVAGMSNDDHTTRTLLVPRRAEGLVLISRGSTSNLDLEAEDVASGRSQIKAFNVTNATAAASPYDYTADGLLLGWGLRNSVGVAEEPVRGGIYSVENSVDELERGGENVHEDNPAEEMNFHGYLDGSASYAGQGANYGYPSCVAAWRPDLLPSNAGLEVGTQFAIDDANVTDAQCRDDRIAPRLVFQAHMAPLDLKFNENGTAAWVTFHGSWDRSEPSGYKLSVIEFADGEPVAAANASDSYTDIFANRDNSQCPDSCFRPVGLAWDGAGNLFMSSDATGEIYLITRTDGTPANGPLPSAIVRNPPPTGTSSAVGGGSGGSPTPTGAAASSSTSSAAAARPTPPLYGWPACLGVGYL